MSRKIREVTVSADQWERMKAQVARTEELRIIEEETLRHDRSEWGITHVERPAGHIGRATSELSRLHVVPAGDDELEQAS